MKSNFESPVASRRELEKFVRKARENPPSASSPRVSSFSGWVYELDKGGSRSKVSAKKSVRVERPDPFGISEYRIREIFDGIGREEDPNDWNPLFVSFQKDSRPLRVSSLELAGSPIWARPDVALQSSKTGEVVVVERKTVRRFVKNLPPEGWFNLRSQLWCYGEIDSWRDEPKVTLVAQVWRFLPQPYDRPPIYEAMGSYAWGRDNEDLANEAKVLFGCWGGSIVEVDSSSPSQVSEDDSEVSGLDIDSTGKPVLPGWAVFERLGRASGWRRMDDFGFVAPVQVVNVWKARYVAAKAFTGGGQYDGFSAETAAAYDGFNHISLTWGPFEGLFKHLIGITKTKDGCTFLDSWFEALKGEYEWESLRNKTLSFGAEQLFLAALDSPNVREKQREGLKRCLAGSGSFNFFYFLSSLRHAISHNTLTPNTRGCPPAAVANLAQFLCETVLEIVGNEFRIRVEGVPSQASQKSKAGDG